MSTVLLLLAIFATSILVVRADARKQLPQVYLFKPLVLLLVIALALQVPETADERRWAIIAGLLCSMAGDAFLMLRHRRFLVGLVCFLLAHLFYCTAFYHALSVYTLLPALPLAVAGVMLYRRLRPGLHKLQVPVVVYLVVILSMAILATNRWILFPSTQSGASAIGAGLFVVSDALIALREFRGGKAWSQVAILSTYFAAQTCIAWG